MHHWPMSQCYNVWTVTSGVKKKKLCLRGADSSGQGAEGAELAGAWEGCPLPSRLGGLGSVVSSPRESGTKPRSQTHFLHILGDKTLLIERKNFHFQLSSAAWTTDPTIFLSLSSHTGGDCPVCPPGYATDCYMWFNKEGSLWNPGPLLSVLNVPSWTLWWGQCFDTVSSMPVSTRISPSHQMIHIEFLKTTNYERRARSWSPPLR